MEPLFSIIISYHWAICFSDTRRYKNRTTLLKLLSSLGSREFFISFTASDLYLLKKLFLKENCIIWEFRQFGLGKVVHKYCSQKRLTYWKEMCHSYENQSIDLHCRSLHSDNRVENHFKNKTGIAEITSWKYI